MISTRFESLGAYFPLKKVPTQDLIHQMEFKPPFDLEEITGIHSRRYRSESEDSFSIALNAAKDCLTRSRYRAEDLDIIISTSISRSKNVNHFYFEPSFALFLARELGASSAIHFDISNACAGMMSGVFMLNQMIRSGIIRNGLVVSGECITQISETATKEIKDAMDLQFASLTVGDSGAAVILDQSEYDGDRIHYVELMTCADYSKLCIGKPSDIDGGLALYTNNREMHKEERIQLWPKFQNDFMAREKTNFDAEKFNYIIHHQVGKKAIQNFSNYGKSIFGTSTMPESLSCVADYANTATTSHFIVLYNHLKEKKVRKGAKFLLVPAASGLVTGCLSTTITELEV
jgi:3-oxoacyl-[acyl-carrier-protein] synthase-3